MKISVVFWTASVLVFGIPFFIEGAFIVILIVLASFLFGLKYFIADRRDLKSAICYVRMADKAKPPIWKRFLSSIATIAVFILLYWVYKEYFIHLFKDLSLPKWSHLFITPLFIYSLTQYYLHFNSSVRAYITGIKLPGRDQEIIDWKSVKELSFVDTTMTIKAEQNENKYHIKSEDKDDLERVIAMWKNETTNDNQL